MPLVFALFSVSIAVGIFALLYPAGIIQLLLHPIPEHIASTVLATLFSTTYCYESIETLSLSSPQFNCFSVSNGKFSKVFRDKTSIESLRHAHKGHVIPGLWDGHGHLIQYGESLGSVSLFGAQSMDEVKNRLIEYKASHLEAGSPEQWLRGVGWDQANFEGKWPKAVRTTRMSLKNIGNSLYDAR